MRWPALMSFVAALGCATAGEDGETPDANETGGRTDGPPPSDAKDEVADAPAGAADARPPIDAEEMGMPDAAPPDAGGPCTPVYIGLLTNPAFDLGPGGGWTESSAGSYPVITNDFAPTTITAQSGTYAAWMGGYFTPPPNDQLFQTVTVPATATALRVTGFRWIATEEAPGTVFDRLTIELRTSAGVSIQTLATYTNDNPTTGWTAFTHAAASPHAGETLQLYFHVTADDTLNTNFFTDTVQLEALACP